MASTLVKIDVHLIFHTKSSNVTIMEADLERIFAYIGGVIKGLDGIPIAIGGRPDHVHILSSLPKRTSLAEYVRAIKANSSKWIKNISPHYTKFQWQEGYGAFSVSATLAEKTIAYILNQKEHHKKRSFQDEYKLFLQAYGISFDERYAFTD